MAINNKAEITAWLMLCYGFVFLFFLSAYICNKSKSGLLE